MYVDMKKVSGSFTVEASLIIPILLMLVVVTIDFGIQMYQECDCLFEKIVSRDLDVVQLFYLRSEIGDLMTNGDSIY